MIQLSAKLWTSPDDHEPPQRDVDAHDRNAPRGRFCQQVAGATPELEPFLARCRSRKRFQPLPGTLLRTDDMGHVPFRERSGSIRRDAPIRTGAVLEVHVTRDFSHAERLRAIVLQADPRIRKDAKIRNVRHHRITRSARVTQERLRLANYLATTARAHERDVPHRPRRRRMVARTDTYIWKEAEPN